MLLTLSCAMMSSGHPVQSNAPVQVQDLVYVCSVAALQSRQVDGDLCLRLGCLSVLHLSLLKWLGVAAVGYTLQPASIGNKVRDSKQKHASLDSVRDSRQAHAEASQCLTCRWSYAAL